MSSIDLFRYPVLTDQIFQRLGYTLDQLDFSYTSKGEEYPLKGESLQGATSTSTLVQITDPRGSWHPDSSGFDVLISGEIENPSFLFGPKGLLPAKHSRLGIGLIWTDRDAKVRGCQKITDINSDRPGPEEFRTEIHFDAGTLRGMLSLKIVLFVEESGNGRAPYSAPKGTIVGELDDIRIVIEGSGSVFPIAEVTEPGQPLWWIETYIEDLNTDKFDEEHVVLNLNRAHPLYPELHTGDDQESSLLKEVFASAIFTLLTEIQNAEDGREAIRKAEDAEAGSVAKILNFMVEMNKWKEYLDQPGELSREIHRWAERNL